MAGAGNYYPPTVSGECYPEMTAFREEMFGPVAAITIAKDAEHALELANDSEFGLSATIFTTDETQARQMAHVWNAVGVYQWLLCQRRASRLWWREEEWLWS
ncbi:succinate semialdehyde dehydrogenase [Escherichia coli]|uniref:Succinate semialdehyde dehydrogenase n=1 Tax=Escherichia coli TaxID=562 RepID=A0A376S8W9_ECOLX|nr:succinate semialdehyde dehydrogenase [Escherichia coli]